MRWLALALALASLPIGCGRGGSADAGSDAPIYESFGRTYTYVISRIDVGPASRDGLTTYGIDLDGVTSRGEGGCTGRPDTTSAITGEPGVEDQFAPVFPAIDSAVGPSGENGALRVRILGGDLLVVLELSNVYSFTNQSSVDVHTFLAHPLPGQALVADATGLGLAPGQSVALAADLGVMSTNITNGQLAVDTRASLPLFAIGLPAALLPVNDLHLRARARADGLSSGELGGAVRVSDLVVWLAATTLAADPTAIEQLFQPDLDPDATGAHCASVSVGVAFEAVPVTLVR